VEENHKRKWLVAAKIIHEQGTGFHQMKIEIAAPRMKSLVTESNRQQNRAEPLKKRPTQQRLHRRLQKEITGKKSTEEKQEPGRRRGRTLA
jgi:hypothetical protein